MRRGDRGANRRFNAAQQGRTGWRWWSTVALVLAGSLAASALIVFGAVRFLAAADREHDKVECVRVKVVEQAKSNASMAATVLNLQRNQAERVAAVAAWRADQERIADELGRC